MLRSLLFAFTLIVSTSAFASADPEIVLLNPNVVHEPADGGQYTFNVRVTGAVEGDTWGLYYLTDAVDDAAMRSIVTDLSPNNHIVTWSTTSLPQGTYHFVAVLKHAGRIFSATAAGSIDIPAQQN